MAKKEKKGKVKKGKGGGAAFAGVSLNPESFVQMGLPDDFDGVISEPVYILFDFPNKEGQATTDKYRVCARFHVEPDEESGIEPFEQVYSVASSDYWVPANVEDGELVPVDVEDWDGEDYSDTAGTHIMPNDALIERLERSGKAATLPKGTNFDFFLGKLGEAGFTDWPTDGSLSFLDGMSAHFDRVRGPERDFGDRGGAQGKSAKDILVITAIHGKAKVGKASVSGKAKASSGKAPGKAAKGKKGKGEDEDAEIKAKLEGIVANILTEKPMSRKKLITKVIQSGKLGNKEKRVALSLLADSSEFMGEDERPWMHDEDDDTFWLSLGDEEEGEEEEDEEAEEEGDVDEEDEEDEEEEDEEDED